MNPEKNISTAQLQQSHYVFGTNQVPWVTTQQLSFGPKKVEQKLNELNISFEIVEHEPALTTEQADSFIEGIEGVRTKTMFLTNKKKT